MATASFVFSIGPTARVPLLRSFLQALPRLCRGLLTGADLGASSAWALMVVAGRLAEPVPPRISARLAYWAWRCGALEEVGAAHTDLMGLCEAVASNVAPAAVTGRATDLLERAGVTACAADPLALELELGTPECDGLAFERGRLALFVPSPRCPPPGDEVPLLVTGHGKHLRATGHVAALRRAGDPAPGAPAGFVLALADPPQELVALLDAVAGDGGVARRRAPRYKVRARAALLPAPDAAPGARLVETSEREHPDLVENLSQGGAFVLTERPVAAGTRVELEVALPEGFLVTTGQVIYGAPRGVGVRFEPGPDGDEVLGVAVEQVVARPRRVLLLDDDRFTRRVLSDALEERGLAVITAEDGVAGLRALAEEILDLDVVVTDLAMPNMDGEEFIRRVRTAGGERELSIVAVTGSPTADVRARLRACGVDEVLGKDAGPAVIAAAVDRAAEVRRRAPPALRAAG